MEAADGRGMVLKEGILSGLALKPYSMQHRDRTLWQRICPNCSDDLSLLCEAHVRAAQWRVRVTIDGMGAEGYGLDAGYPPLHRRYP